MYRSHYHYLEKNLPDVFKSLGLDWNRYVGIIAAHGDKGYCFMDAWAEGGLHFYHGMAIYLLSRVRPYCDEVRDTKGGWVDPGRWVLENKDRFLPYLPKVDLEEMKRK